MHFGDGSFRYVGKESGERCSNHLVVGIGERQSAKLARLWSRRVVAGGGFPCEDEDGMVEVAGAVPARQEVKT